MWKEKYVLDYLVTELLLILKQLYADVVLNDLGKYCIQSLKFTHDLG